MASDDRAVRRLESGLHLLRRAREDPSCVFKSSVLRVLLVAMDLTEWCKPQASRAVRIPGSSLLPLIIITLSQVFPGPLVRLEKVSSISINSKRPTKLGV